MYTQPSIIIPAAGPGRRMKSYGPKALINLHNGQTVINRQITILRKFYPDSDIIVTIGFEADKIRKELSKDIIVIENKNYIETNVGYSLGLALKATSSNSILIVYGDLVFNEATLADFSPTQSTALIDSKNRLHREEVGVTIVNNRIERFSYGLPIKWAQIVYLTRQELDIFKFLAYDYNKRKFFGFELLNQVLDCGGRLIATEPDKMELVEIDNSRDIAIAKKVQ